MSDFKKIVSQYRIPHVHVGDESGGVCYGKTETVSKECGLSIKAKSEESWSTTRTDQGFCGTCGKQFQVYTIYSYGCALGHWYDYDGFVGCVNPSCPKYHQNAGSHTHTVVVGSKCTRQITSTIHVLDCPYSDCGLSSFTYEKNRRTYTLTDGISSQNAGITVTGYSWKFDGKVISTSAVAPILSNGVYTLTVTGRDNKTGESKVFTQSYEVVDYKPCPTVYYGEILVEEIYKGEIDVVDCFIGTTPVQ